VGARFPFPSFPSGWYAVAFSPDLAPGEVRTVRYFDRDIVLFRSQAGVVAAFGATCPHLGAHLGDGKVEGECLRCPFHGWAFEGSGRCVDVPYAPKIPPRARASTWPILEQNGLVFVYYGARGEQPPWTPPPLELEGWTANRTIRWELCSHPQEVGENTVDAAHLVPVHDAISAEVTHFEQRDHVMNSVIRMVATGRVIGMPEDVNDVELDVTLHGLGQIVSRTHVITAGLRTIQRIHPTPIDRERIHIFAAGNTRHMPDAAYTAEIDEIFWGAFVRDFVRDFPIWEKKTYLDRPMLAGGDGPIGAYRRWARQFYAASAPESFADARSGDAHGEERSSPVARLTQRLRDAAPREALGSAASALLDRARRIAGRAPAPEASIPQPSNGHGVPARPLARRFASVDAYFQSLERLFDASAAGELEAVFQWTLSGDRAVEHFAEVRGGTIQAAPGIHVAPTVTIEMSADDYLSMVNGELNGALAFSTGRGRLRGPVRLAMRMRQLFPLDRVS
jgi:nitrite reductase/ring-hydroxylating ferredoxin subunit/putative sterol carrier protein